MTELDTRESRHRWRSCTSKAKYPSAADAEAQVEYTRLIDPRAPALRWYPCPYCTGWHLTSQRERSDL